MRNLFLLLLFVSANAQAQKGAKPGRFAATITPADLRQRLYIVAGREMEGRETATEGQRKAAAYIEGEFKRMGLQPGANGGYQMHFKVYQDSLAHAALNVGDEAFTLNNDFSVNPENSSATMRF